MEQSLKAKILEAATREILQKVKDDSLAKTRALINQRAELALLKYQTGLISLIDAFNYEVENPSFIEAPDNEINPYQFENQK